LIAILGTSKKSGTQIGHGRNTDQTRKLIRFWSVFIGGDLALFRLGLCPHRAEEMDFSQDVVFLSAFLGGSQAGLQFSQFVFAMIAAFQFTTALDHCFFLDFSGAKLATMRFY
jgi:hypothetical protein